MRLDSHRSNRFLCGATRAGPCLAAALLVTVPFALLRAQQVPDCPPPSPLENSLEACVGGEVLLRLNHSLLGLTGAGEPGNYLSSEDAEFYLRSIMDAANRLFDVGMALPYSEVLGQVEYVPLDGSCIDAPSPIQLVSINVFDRSEDYAPASAGINCVALDAPTYRGAPGQTIPLARANSVSVMHHELFHTTQFRMWQGLTQKGAVGKWLIEAQASLAGDRLDPEPDAIPTAEYFSRIINYLYTAPYIALPEASYAAAIFWAYFAEQFGESLENPQQGIDALGDVWAAMVAEDNADGLAILDDLIAERGRGSLLDFFEDFALANYLIDFDAASVAAVLGDYDRFHYRDNEDVSQDGWLGIYRYPDVLRECFCIGGAGCTSLQQAALDPCQNVTLPLVLRHDSTTCEAALAGEEAGRAACEACGVDPDDASACAECTNWGSLSKDCEKYKVDTLSTEYLEFDISSLAGDTCGVLEVRARSCAEVGWMLVGVGAGKELRWVSRTRGTTFARSVPQAPGEDPLEKLALIVIGLDAETPFEVRIEREVPKLAVLQPTQAVPAYVGLPVIPDRFLARVRVEGLNPVPESSLCENVPSPEREAAALRPEDFVLTVIHPATQQRAEATVLTAEHVGSGEYHLSVQAPPFNAEQGAYDLEVTLVNGCDVTRSPLSIIYGNIAVNHVLAIDRSASMSVPEGFSKLDAAKEAAALYVSAVASKDRVGVVVFDGRNECEDNAQTIVPLEGAGDDHRNAAYAAIEAVDADGLTSIGDGLWRAEDLLDQFDNPSDVRTLLVLSDGEENDERFVLEASNPCDDSSILQPALPRIVSSGTIANSLAFGPQSNQGLMQRIATDGGGVYSYVDVTEGDGGGNSLTQSLPLALRLGDSFLRALAHARKLERIDFASGRALEAMDTFVKLDVQAGDPQASAGVFFVQWDGAKVGVDAELFDPKGDPIGGRAERIEGPAHIVWHLIDDGVIDPDTWSIGLRPEGDVAFIAGVLGRDPAGVHVRFSTSQERTGGVDGIVTDFSTYEEGVPVTLRATVTDRKGPVTGAEVVVQVERPDGRVAPSRCELRLLDDGRNNDGEPSDGVYGLVYTHTDLASERGVSNDDPKRPAPPGTRGTYIVAGTVAGRTNDKIGFERQIEGHFHVLVGEKDLDGDGLPTAWELWYGTDPNVDDADRDHDADGLDSLAELRNGTHPFVADSDGDGELDGSEVRGGRCPTVAGDGIVPVPRDVEIVTDAGHVGLVEVPDDGILLRFPSNPSYGSMRIFRSKDSAPFENVATLSASDAAKGTWVDRDVNRGSLYSYRVQPLARDASSGRLSRVVTARFAGDPTPPFVRGIIHNGAIFTDRLKLRIKLDFSARAKFYRVSDQPYLDGVPLRVITGDEIVFDYPRPRVLPAPITVWLDVVTENGISSGPIPLPILYDPSGDLDRDRLLNGNDPDDDGDGLSDDEELGRYGTNPTARDTDGDGLSDGDEVRRRIDPLSSDTDGDGSPDGDDPDPTDPTIPPRCPSEKDIVCSGVDVGSPVGGGPGTWSAKVDAAPVGPGFAPMYIFRVTKENSNEEILIGPQPENLASFELDEGTWTVAVTVDWGDGCPQIECSESRVVVGCVETEDSVSIAGSESAAIGEVVTLRATLGGVDGGGREAYSWEIGGAIGEIVGAANRSQVEITSTVAGEVLVRLNAGDGVCSDLARAVHRIRFSGSDCPPRGDISCEGVDVTGPEGNAPGEYIFRARASSASGASLLYLFEVESEATGQTASSGFIPQTGVRITLPVGVWLVRTSVSGGEECPPVTCESLRVIVAEEVAAPLFKRGDSNADGSLNIADASHILGFLFLGTAEPPCLDASDADDSGRINLTDAVLVLNFLFTGGREPPAPHGVCGEDLTADNLDCGSYPVCER